jgi:26S proteasome regulatory subunit N7
MAPYYRLVTSSPASQSNPLLAHDATLFESMEKTNKEELDKLDERLKEAQKTEGESEISDALKAKANHLTRVGDKVRFCVFKFQFGLVN